MPVNIIGFVKGPLDLTVVITPVRHESPSVSCQVDIFVIIIVPHVSQNNVNFADVKVAEKGAVAINKHDIIELCFESVARRLVPRSTTLAGQQHRAPLTWAKIL